MNATVLALPIHLPTDAWDDEDMDASERLARVEAKMEFLAETVIRNREEAIAARNDMKIMVEQLTRTIGDQSEKLGGLLGTMEQIKGARTALATIGAILATVGLVGIYQIAAWLGFVKAHP